MKVESITCLCLAIVTKFVRKLQLIATSQVIIIVMNYHYDSELLNRFSKLLFPKLVSTEMSGLLKACCDSYNVEITSRLDSL